MWSKIQKQSQILVIPLLLVGCSPSTPEPAADPSGAAEPKAAEAPVAEAAPAEEEQPTSETEAEPASPPSERLTEPDIAFAFDYNSSGMREKHDEKCQKVSGDDPAKMAKCREKERAQFKADVLYFEKDPEGKLFFVVFQRSGTTLKEIFRSPFEFENEGKNSITLKLSRGYPALNNGSQSLPLSVPDEYTVEIDDPQKGKLPYRSKQGLIEAKKPQ